MSQFQDPGAPRSSTEAVREETAATTARARDAAGEVASTAGEQARSVVEETGAQAKSVLSDVRDLVTHEADGQTRRLSAAVRQWSDEFGTMAGHQEDDSAAKDIVRQLAQNGRRAADYLDEHSSSELLDEVRHFARRRPGTFLAAAALAGLAVGRLAKAGTADSTAQHRQTEGSPAMPPSPETSPSTMPASEVGSAAMPLPPTEPTEPTEPAQHRRPVPPTVPTASPLPDEVTR